MASTYQPPSIFEYTWKAYTENFWVILLMAVPALFALAIPILVGTPTFIAMGGTYLRTGSIPDLNSTSAALMLVSLLLSLFLMSFAMVNINLVIKSQRTLTQIGKEVMRNLSTTTLSVFWMYLIGVLMLFIIQLVTFEYNLQAILAPLLSMGVGMGLLFLPTAMVMDDVRPWRALERSARIIVTKAPLVLLWMAIALLVLTMVDGLSLWLLPHPLASWLVLLFNSLVALPYLVVMLGQIYISKYTILA